MRLRLTSNVDAMFDQLEAKLASRIPIAEAIALSRTVGEVAQAVRVEMVRVFDRPNPYTLGSVRYDKATVQKREASVWLNDESSGGGHAAAEYLIPEISGGVRVEKRSEYILRKAGILPDGMSIVPGAKARLDAYGNISAGLIQQVLSALRLAETVSGRTANRPLRAVTARQKRARARQGEFFVAQRNRPHGRHLAPGIYQRVGLRIAPIIMFVRTPSYTGVFDFEGVAQATADEALPRNLREQIAESVRRAA